MNRAKNMESKIVVTLLKKEINDSLGNRWFMLYAAAFTGLALLLSWLSLSSGGTGYNALGTSVTIYNCLEMALPVF